VEFLSKSNPKQIEWLGKVQPDDDLTTLRDLTEGEIGRVARHKSGDHRPYEPLISALKLINAELDKRAIFKRNASFRILVVNDSYHDAEKLRPLGFPVDTVDHVDQTMARIREQQGQYSLVIIGTNTDFVAPDAYPLKEVLASEFPQITLIIQSRSSFQKFHPTVPFKTDIISYFKSVVYLLDNEFLAGLHPVKSSDAMTATQTFEVGDELKDHLLAVLGQEGFLEGVKNIRLSLSRDGRQLYSEGWGISDPNDLDSGQ
jgi:hypothetical protein